MDSRLGLNQTTARPEGAPRQRTAPKSLPKRDGPIWATVKVVREHATTPSVTAM